jgi:hypothetical protein
MAWIGKGRFGRGSHVSVELMVRDERLLSSTKAESIVGT